MYAITVGETTGERTGKSASPRSVPARCAAARSADVGVEAKQLGRGDEFPLLHAELDFLTQRWAAGRMLLLTEATQRLKW